MSLLSILRTSLSSRPLLSSCCSLPSFPRAIIGGRGGMDGAATAATAPIITQHTRSVWSEVIRQIPSDDPNKVGQLTFEDPDLADTRMLRALRAEGMREDGGLSDIIYVLNFVGRVTSHRRPYFVSPKLIFAHELSLLLHHAAPLRKRPNFVRHEKEWMRRKRLKMERRYLRMQEGVEELKAYIKFKQDNKPSY
ncbi:hypothetical protein ACHAXH_005539 [Discostella pseudostelligera]